MVPRRVFVCSYGTWKKIRKCRSSIIFKKLPSYCAPSAPRLKKFKKQMHNIRSTYEFEKAVPYLKAREKFRLKNVCRDFWYVFFLYFAINILFCLLNKIQFLWCFCRKTIIKLKECWTFCRDASLQPPGVRLGTLTWLTVQFNPRDTVSCEIGSAFGLRTF